MDGHARFNGELMVKLLTVPPHFTDDAWTDGAHKLGESCVEECTPEQLKMLLGRGERVLVRLDDDGVTVGWGVYVINQLPNMRVFFITNLWARHAKFPRFFEALKQAAKSLGCSRIRCSALDAQSRIFQTKCQFKPIYTTLEVTL